MLQKIHAGVVADILQNVSSWLSLVSSVLYCSIRVIFLQQRALQQDSILHLFVFFFLSLGTMQYRLLTHQRH